MPAQELSEAGKYLAGAFGVFLALLLIYVAIMASKLSRMERELGELGELAQRGPREGDEAATGPHQQVPPPPAPRETVK
ncbi:hypothetical protein BH20ACT18_BH20ACT18_12590 [soil metagenome]